MIKMIVTDMDGTILKKDLTVSQKTLDAIQTIRDQGIIFTVATGRPDQLMKEYIDKLQLKDPFIMYNGSVIGHPFEDERIFERHLSVESIREIIDYCNRENIIWMAYTKDKIISKPNYRVAFFKDRNTYLLPHQKSVFETIEDLDYLIDNYVIHKILIIENDENKFKECKKFVSHYKSLVITTSQKGFIDINSFGMSKGNALKKLAEYYTIDVKEIVAFGDQENDLTMLQTAGIGVAMGNASEFVKSHADQITISNEEDGFAVWVNANIK